MDVSYSFPERTGAEEKNVIDFGLLDQEGKVRGWSGSERGSVTISACTATPGYRIGEIRPGSWAAVLGLYRIHSELDVEVTVSLHAVQKLLLAGDLHLHTVHSDGAYTPAEVITYTTRAGLDFIALTDHNNTEQNLDVPRSEGPIVISGMEYTNYRGHAGFFFPNEGMRFDDDPFSGSFEEMAALFRRAKERGALISINHPTCSACPWSFGWDGFPFDLVEVWNGLMKDSEMAAIAWWHARLSAGARLPAVGGSDMHRHDPFRNYGFPTTFVHADSRSKAGIFDALRAGRSYISYTKNGPQPSLRIGGSSLGDTVGYTPGLEGEITVLWTFRGDLVKVLDREGIVEFRVPVSGPFSARFPVKPGAGFYRAEVWRELLPGKSMLCALTNPVYIG